MVIQINNNFKIDMFCYRSSNMFFQKYILKVKFNECLVSYLKKETFLAILTYFDNRA